MTKRRSPDYGIDAPGLCRFFFGSGAAAALASTALWQLITAPGVALQLLIGVLSLAAVYLLGMGCLMLFESKIVKTRNRDIIFDRLSWRGNEQVLDVGCGRGLVVVGVAQRLTTGHATGVDIWQVADQT